MNKNKSEKKYRHGIKSEKNPKEKVKISKADLLRRIEALEFRLSQPIHVPAISIGHAEQELNDNCF
jgi:hypothetical protein